VSADAVTTLQSGLVVAVPEVEPLVGEHRLRLDPRATLGAPAHITVLYPFLPPGDLDEHVFGRVRDLVAQVPEFSFGLTRTAWFAGEVLWLVPEPDHGFVTLTGLFSAAFPDYPPYGGQFEVVTFHLTVGDRARVPQLRAAEQAITPGLPVACVARAVTLLVEQESGQWATAATFPLAPRSA
jgi:hypothetical protein